MAGETEIVFEDLRGVVDDETVEVDLDNDDAKNHGITRRPSKAAEDDPDDDRADPDGDDLDDDLDDPDDRDDPDNDDPDDDGDGESGRADDDDDGDSYSKKVRARIARETRATARERERAEYWEKQAKAAAERLNATSKEQAETTVKRATKEIEEAEGLLEAAIEAGNTKDQVRLTSRLTDLKAEVIQAKANLDSGTGNFEFEDARVRTSPSEGVPDKAKRWMEKHADWYGAKGFERQTRLANRIDKDVFNDGYDPQSDEYYRELNRRIRRKEPDLFGDRDRRRGRNNDGRRRQSPVAGVSDGGNQRRSSRGSKVELTEADFANMRRFNLDPNDPEVLKEYARNKREADSGGRR